MKETDELRRVAAKTECANGRCEKLYRGDLERIADRIDAEHERGMLKAQAEGIDMGFASADDWLADHEDAMEEHGWVRLPVDADGVPIRIGDMLDETDLGTYAFLPAKVVGYHECCDEVLPIVENGGEWQVMTEKVFHCRTSTVEDVLREFADRVCSSGHQWGLDAADTIAEYAGKLRLAGDE